MESNGCLIWTGTQQGFGYGRTTTRPQRLAHRVSYEVFVGPIPEGLAIDHLCGNRLCVNPFHLEAVTPKENIRRASSRQTHCKHGHLLSGDNVRLRGEATRICRACARRHAREARARIAMLASSIFVALVLAATAQASHKHEQFAGHRDGNQAWQWKWQKWLPDKWQRIGACETGYGKRPGRWDWNSGTYQGAFGFYHGSWDQFKPVSWWPSEAYLATPWQQYQTALAIWRRYGFSGWGCRAA